MKKLFPLLALVLFVIACNNKNESNQNTHQLKTTQTKDIWQNPDSFAKPITLPAGIPIPITAGKPTINPTNLNAYIAGTPKVIIAGIPKTNTPGTDTFSLPKTIPVFFVTDTASTSLYFGGGPRVRSKPVGLPETVIAKAMANKDKTPPILAHLINYKV